MSVAANNAAPWLSVIMPIYRGEQWIEAAGQARLHLGEREGPAVVHDEIELAAAEAAVPRDDPVPEAFVVLGRQLFAAAAELVTLPVVEFAHTPDGREKNVT